MTRIRNFRISDGGYNRSNFSGIRKGQPDDESGLNTLNSTAPNGSGRGGMPNLNRPNIYNNRPSVDSVRQ